MMPSPPSSPPPSPTGDATPTLDYAAPTPEADRLAQAEALLLAGGVTADYVALFESTAAAAEFYGRFQTERFAPHNADGVCKECGRPTGDLAVVHWQAYFPMRMLEFSVESTAQMVNLATYHPLCRPCLATTRRRMRLHRRGIAIAVMLAFAGFIYLGWSAYSPPWAVALKERVGFYFFVPPVLLIIAAAVMVHVREQMALRQLPRGLRELEIGMMTDVRGVETREPMQFQLRRRP